MADNGSDFDTGAEHASHYTASVTVFSNVVRQWDFVRLSLPIRVPRFEGPRDEHPACKRIFSVASQAGIQLACTGQIVREYLVVATRPIANNGLDLSSSDALRNVRSFGTRLHLLPEPIEVVAELGELISAHGLAGKRIHDANLIASMKVDGVGTLVTSNTDDSSVFPSVRSPTPAIAEAEMKALVP